MVSVLTSAISALLLAAAPTRQLCVRLAGMSGHAFLGDSDHTLESVYEEYRHESGISTFSVYGVGAYMNVILSCDVSYSFTTRCG